MRKLVPGNLFQIPLKQGRMTYCKVYGKGVVIFYNIFTLEALEPAQIENADILFAVYIHIDAFAKSDWAFIQNRAFTMQELSYEIIFFKQDIANPNLCWLVDLEGKENITTLEKCFGIERLAVWDFKMIEERLEDFYYHKENRFIKNSNDRLKAAL